MDNEISTLEAEVNSTKNMVGHPYTATTAGAMSDQTKIYVYTGSETGYTAGHWYYHNGTAWTDGGVYNSVAVNTDTSLTVSGQAADSKAVGDAIDELDGDLSDVKSDLNDLSDVVDDKYEKPPTGIPASDLASGVIPDVTGKADKVQNATNGNFASLDANGNLTDSGHKHSDYLTEHQDLSDYVKNTDYASTSQKGIVGIDTGYGVGIVDSSHNLYVNKSTSEQVKVGAHQYRPIVPYTQHESTFYGLAKAAGDTTQASSSNAVGTYTDDAKTKIQKMLGIYEAPWELIREDTFTQAASATVQINVDGNGNAFELTDAVLLLEMLSYESESKIQNYFKFYDGSKEVSRSSYVNTTISANSASYGIFIVIEKKNDLVFVSTKPAVKTTNSTAQQLTYREGFSNIGSIFENANYKITKVQMPDTLYGKVHYKLYGKRKWQ